MGDGILASGARRETPGDVLAAMTAARDSSTMTKDAGGLSPQVLDRAVDGDRNAQAVLLKTYDGYIRRLLHRLMGPSPDLDDLAQTVMIRVLTSLSTVRREGALSTWVGGICVHVARDALRRKKVRTRVLAEPEAGEDTASAGSRPDDIAGARADLERCWKALDALSESQRTALVLRVFEGHSVDEVAALMGAAKSTTRLRLYYGRKAFAKALTQLGISHPVPGGEDAP